ncbi:MAG TPA: universal stress protein [Gemmatimonadaceae bacterium]|nr:universal stress protein [Gemmatimonadaceae bacterium]
MISVIVVPLDGSPLAEAALPTAVALANAARATMHLVLAHVPIIDPELPSFAAVDHYAREQESAYLAAAASRISAGGVKVTTSIEENLAGSAIVQAAEREHADLIVMATHGRTGLSRAWMGSVADAVVQQARIPVLLVRPKEGDEDTRRTVRAEDDVTHAAAADANAGSMTPAPLFTRILIPLDGSVAAESILPHALAVGALGGASYDLLRVVRPVMVPIHPYTFAAEGTIVDTGIEESEMERARAYLDDAARTVRSMAPGSTVATDVCLSDSPARAILDRARGAESDLVALTTTGRGLTRLVLGSVTDKVLRAGTLPVLLFRPPRTEQ